MKINEIRVRTELPQDNSIFDRRNMAALIAVSMQLVPRLHILDTRGRGHSFKIAWLGPHFSKCVSHGFDFLSDGS